MRRTGSFRCLDGTVLKVIAMVSMVFDHVGDNFFPDFIWMRVIGRIALPIFAFCVAEGFIHTHDRGGYLRRMAIFACVSEIPFDLVTSGKLLEFSHQNIMVTFAWAILGLICFEKITVHRTRNTVFLGLLFLLLFGAFSAPLRMDYNILAVGLIFIFALLRKMLLWKKNLIAMVCHALLRNVGIYWFGLLGFLPIFLYNGKRGAGLKWLFYIFYPGHLLLIWALRSLLI